MDFAPASGGIQHAAYVLLGPSLRKRRDRVSGFTKRTLRPSRHEDSFYDDCTIALAACRDIQREGRIYQRRISKHGQPHAAVAGFIGYDCSVGRAL